VSTSSASRLLGGITRVPRAREDVKLPQRPLLSPHHRQFPPPPLLLLNPPPAISVTRIWSLSCTLIALRYMRVPASFDTRLHITTLSVSMDSCQHCHARPCVDHVPLSLELSFSLYWLTRSTSARRFTSFLSRPCKNHRWCISTLFRDVLGIMGL
jgi:hypothetical protein